MIYGRMSMKNNNPKGIILILIAMMVFSVQDGIMKHILVLCHFMKFI